MAANNGMSANSTATMIALYSRIFFTLFMLAKSIDEYVPMSPMRLPKAIIATKIAAFAYVPLKTVTVKGLARNTMNRIAGTMRRNATYTE